MIGRMLLMAIAIRIAQVAFTQIPNCENPWLKVEGNETNPVKCTPGKVPNGCLMSTSTCQFSLVKWFYVCCYPNPTGVFAASSPAGTPECCGQYTPVDGGVECMVGKANQCPYMSSCMESTNANITLCCQYNAAKNMTGAVC